MSSRKQDVRLRHQGYRYTLGNLGLDDINIVGKCAHLGVKYKMKRKHAPGNKTFIFVFENQSLKTIL